MTQSSLSVQEITPFQLKELLAQDTPPVILDVRDTAELSMCAFSRFIHIPLSNLPQELDRLPEDQSMVIVCHHGLRSLHAAIFLKSRGFNQVCNLKGGIHAWATQVDTTMKIY